MYLSRIRPTDSPRRVREVLSRFGTEYARHQHVWSLFADSPDRRRDFLYRIDTDERGLVIHVLSARTPEARSDLWRVETKRFAPKLRVGQRLAFALRANPTVTKDGKRHDVVMEAKRRMREEGTAGQLSHDELLHEAGTRWLTRRQERSGFAVVPGRLLLGRHAVHEFAKPKGGKVRFASIDFDGILEVRDPASFVATLQHGIGHSKAFGCGLMLCKRSL